MLLCATGAVILLGTSAPIFGRIFRDNPSGVPIEFYDKWTLPIAVLFVFLAGLGQLFWWNKMSVEQMNRVLLRPIALSVASTIAVIVFTPFVERTVRMAVPDGVSEQPLAQEANLFGGFAAFWDVYGMGILLLLLVFMAFFALYGNRHRAVADRAGQPRSWPAAPSPTSASPSSSSASSPRAASRTRSPRRPPTSDVPTVEGRQNFVLAKGETRQVEGYRVTYTGKERNAEGRQVYTLDFVDPRGRPFTLKPVVYKSDQEQWIQHPDLRLYVEKDIYAAVTPAAMFEQTSEEGGPAGGELSLARGDSATLGQDEFDVHFVGLDTDVNAGDAAGLDRDRRGAPS